MMNPHPARILILIRILLDVRDERAREEAAHDRRRECKREPVFKKEEQQVVETLLNLNVKQLKAIINILDKEHGITATPAVAAVAAAPAPGQAAAAEDAQSTFDVVITSVDAKGKLALIRHVKEQKGITTKEAMDFVKELPQTFQAQASKEVAEKFKKELEEKGAKVELK